MMKEYPYFPELTLDYPPNKIEIRNLKIGEKPMTILIGALCDKGESIVLMADKLTILQPQSVIFGHATKGFLLTPKSMILVSGSVSNLSFIEPMRILIKDNMIISQIAEVIANSYKYYRLEKIASDVLSLRGFYSFNDFHSKQKNLDYAIVREIDQFTMIYNINVEIILAGVDVTGHIFHIIHPGSIVNYDTPGVWCAGYGAGRAIPVFEFFDYSLEMNLENVISIAYVAKKRAEILSGIGKDTDIWHINKQGIKKVENETILLLEIKYNEQKEKYQSLLKEFAIKKEEVKTR